MVGDQGGNPSSRAQRGGPMGSTHGACTGKQPAQAPEDTPPKTPRAAPKQAIRAERPGLGRTHARSLRLGSA